MFAFATRLTSRSVSSSIMSRAFGSSTATNSKVAVLGAAGGIGQPLSLLLKLSPEVSELACYDIVNTPGVAADLSHIPTASKVVGSLPSGERGSPAKDDEGLKAALTDAKVVVIPAGIPRKPGMSRDDLYSINAGIVKTLVEGCAAFCPDAVLTIISNPVNSTVPIAAEVMKKAGVYNPKKVVGVTTLDVCRAKTFVAEAMGADPDKTNVTVIGGHAGTTILPLYSQVDGYKPTPEELDAITHRTQFGGDEVVEAKAGLGSATLSMAYAGYLFAEQVLKGLRGEKDIIQCAYVESKLTDSPFFASPCKFGPNGVEEVLPYGEITEYEQKILDEMIPTLKASVEKGVNFVNSD